MHFEWWVGSDRFGYKNSKSRIALFEFAACTMLRLARQRLLEFMYRVWYIAVRSPCPKRRGGSWTTPNQSLRSPSSRSDFDDDNPNTGPAVCAGQARDQCSTSAVLPGRCVTGGVVAESFNCLCLTPVRLFFSDHPFGRPSFRTNCVEYRPRFHVHDIESHALAGAIASCGYGATGVKFLASKLRPSWIKARQALA